MIILWNNLVQILVKPKPSRPVASSPPPQVNPYINNASTYGLAPFHTTSYLTASTQYYLVHITLPYAWVNNSISTKISVLDLIEINEIEFISLKVREKQMCTAEFCSKFNELPGISNRNFDHIYSFPYLMDKKHRIVQQTI